jgi:hypothetical protein
MTANFFSYIEINFIQQYQFRFFICFMFCAVFFLHWLSGALHRFPTGSLRFVDDISLACVVLFFWRMWYACVTSLMLWFFDFFNILRLSSLGSFLLVRFFYAVRRVISLTACLAIHVLFPQVFVVIYFQETV